MSTNGGFLSLTLLSPFHRMKTINQVSRLLPQHTQPATITLSQIKQCHGLKSIFRGNFLNIISLYISKISETKDIALSFAIYAAALPLIYPIDKAATYFASDIIGKEPQYKGFFKFVKEQSNIKSMYRGFGFFFFTEVAFAGAIATTYRSMPGQILNKTSDKDEKYVKVFSAGAAYSILLYPIDTIKRNLQVDGVGLNARLYNGWRDCFKQLKASSSLYNGFQYQLICLGIQAVIPLAITAYFLLFTKGRPKRMEMSEKSKDIAEKAVPKPIEKDPLNTTQRAVGSKNTTDSSKILEDNQKVAHNAKSDNKNY